MVVRRFTFVVFALSLLVTLAFVQRRNVPIVKGSPSVHQGDLVLTGNTVYTIEGRFDINGSIFVEENATLILRNALLNFTGTKHFQLNMTFQNPANGNPRLIVENATITSTVREGIVFRGNSSASINELTASDNIDLYAYDFSVIEMSDSSLLWIHAEMNSSISIFNCTLRILRVAQRANVAVSNCTIEISGLCAVSVNCSVSQLEPGFASYWNFEENCSVNAATDGYFPNLTLTDTNVDWWEFSFRGSSNATLSNSVDCWVYAWDFVNVWVYDCKLFEYGSSDNSKIWIVNSTLGWCGIPGEHSEIYLSWYLDVHVVDSIGQDVPSANVTATFPNATLAESQLTDARGWARLTLLGWTENATGWYPVGIYRVEATYETYSTIITDSVTENKQITLTLEDFIIPEFPPRLILPLLMIATLLTVTVHRRKQL